MLVPALVAFLGMASNAAPSDRDYETIIPSPRTIPSAPQPTVNPPGFADSPLVIADHSAGPFPRMRFVLRDGSVMIGQVLGFDGQMYALRLAHGTALMRKDLFTTITPVSARVPHQPPVRPARAIRSRPGARY